VWPCARDSCVCACARAPPTKKKSSGSRVGFSVFVNIIIINCIIISCFVHFARIKMIFLGGARTRLTGSSTINDKKYSEKRTCTHTSRSQYSTIMRLNIIIILRYHRTNVEWSGQVPNRRRSLEIRCDDDDDGGGRYDAFDKRRVYLPVRLQPTYC